MSKDPNDDFYNGIMGKYKTKSDPFEIVPKNNKKTRYRRMPKLTLEKLKRALNEIKINTGFNTNAPESMYLYAKHLFDDLRDELVNIESSASNFKFFEIAEYALFQKLDHMEALEYLEKVDLE